jgi:hypothetical protein
MALQRTWEIPARGWAGTHTRKMHRPDPHDVHTYACTCLHGPPAYLGNPIKSLQEYGQVPAPGKCTVLTRTMYIHTRVHTYMALQHTWEIPARGLAGIRPRKMHRPDRHGIHTYACTYLHGAPAYLGNPCKRMGRYSP